MSVPVPLGVRIYQTATGLDRWVTQLVDDISFRSTIPGGFAAATISLHNDGPDSWTRLAKLFNRVQICDLRTMEIAWEGRIESPRRNSANDAWEISCLGAMVTATDINMPYFAIDGMTDKWVLGGGTVSSLFNPSKNDTARTITMKPNARSWTGPNHFDGVAIWQMAEMTGQRIGRWDITYSGTAATASFRTSIDVGDGGGIPTQNNVDVTAWNAAAIRKANRVVTDFTSLSAQRLVMAFDISATATLTADNYGAISQPRIQAQRVNKLGTKLQAAADYPNDYVTVAQIVEDVVGRYLVRAWNFQFNDLPYAGQVRGDDAYIDTSSTAQITDLTFYDGATAADVLNALTAAQTDAYWAIWESSYGAGGGDPRFRFEWTRWPAGWGYQASSVDGLDEQPDGSGLYNYLSYVFDQNTTIPYGLPIIQPYWDANNNQLLSDAGLARGLVLRRDDVTDGPGGFSAAAARMADYRRTLNTGTLTVRRPIHLYDPGDTSSGGMSRMLDPWMIRPGKLIKITDLPARGMSNDLRPTPGVPNRAQDGVVFRVVSTEYRSADNSCVLELDSVPGWNMATQVAAPKPSGKLVARG